MRFTKWPIIILSSPRTGSTALAHDIVLQSQRVVTDVLYFNEPATHDPRNNTSKTYSDMSKLTFALNHDSKFILKAHSFDALSRYPQQLLDIVDKSYVIRLRRKDIIAQIVSQYICMKRKIWSYNTNTVVVNDSDKIDMDEIYRSVEFITKYYQVADRYPNRVDEDLYYEDLHVTHNICLPTPKPTNYNLIYETVKNVVDLSKQKTI